MESYVYLVYWMSLSISFRCSAVLQPHLGKCKEISFYWLIAIVICLTRTWHSFAIKTLKMEKLGKEPSPSKDLITLTKEELIVLLFAASEYRT